jgi:PLP dependent protein
MLGIVRSSRHDVLDNLDRIRDGVVRAAGRAGRSASDVLLVAAAKRVDPRTIRWVAEAGVHAIGQNYVQELRDVRPELADLPIRWHFIGTLQRGTAHHVADLADVVETVAGERAAARLAGRAARAGRTIDVLIEVDFTGERSGVAPSHVSAAADMVSSLDGVRLTGLMTLPPLTETAEQARPWFARLRGLRDEVREKHPDVLELSMGMSLDYEVAIEEGATMVRIGTALFGPRTS